MSRHARRRAALVFAVALSVAACAGGTQPPTAAPSASAAATDVAPATSGRSFGPTAAASVGPASSDLAGVPELGDVRLDVTRDVPGGGMIAFADDAVWAVDPKDRGETNG